MTAQKNKGKKIRCLKCRTSYYDLGKRSAECPKCRENALIPVGTIAKVRLSIKRGGYNDPSQGWTEGYATKSASGAIYLNCTFEVTKGPKSGKKFSTLIGLWTSKSAWWGNEGRRTLRNILNSAYGISDTDYSVGARELRDVNSFGAFEGIEFTGEIDRRKGPDGILRNELKAALTPDDPQYEQVAIPHPKNVRSQVNAGRADGKIIQCPLDDPNYTPLWLRKI